MIPVQPGPEPIGRLVTAEFDRLRRAAKARRIEEAAMRVAAASADLLRELEEAA